jgi:hypothetical protein
MGIMVNAKILSGYLKPIKILIIFKNFFLYKFKLKAFKEHKLADVFLQPGDCDLTADVDFLFLKHIAGKSNSKSYIFLYFYSKIYFIFTF